MYNIKELNFKYNNKIFLNNISFDIEDNHIFGILGPNGAGKTTLIECLEGLKKISSGELIFNKKKIGNDFNKNIGIQFQEYSFFQRLTVKEIFKYFSEIFNNKDNLKKIMHDFDLLEHKNKYYMKLSSGLMQKLAVSIAFLNKDAKIIFLDEPTSGLDVFSRKQLWQIIKSYKDKGKIIILTTHYIEEAEELCDQLIIIDKGNIIEKGTPGFLIEKYCKKNILEVEFDKNVNMNDLLKIRYIDKVKKLIMKKIFMKYILNQIH